MVLLGGTALRFCPPARISVSPHHPSATAARFWPLSTLYDWPISQCGPCRDATRGGLAAVLHEWSAACGCTLEVDEAQIPVTDDVRGPCELLGLDPLFVACEGTMAVAVAAGFGQAAVEALRCVPEASRSAVIGRCVQLNGANVSIRRLLGRLQPLDDPAGRLLPRIC